MEYQYYNLIFMCLVVEKFLCYFTFFDAIRRHSMFIKLFQEVWGFRSDYFNHSIRRFRQYYHNNTFLIPVFMYILSFHKKINYFSKPCSPFLLPALPHIDEFLLLKERLTPLQIRAAPLLKSSSVWRVVAGFHLMFSFKHPLIL